MLQTPTSASDPAPIAEGRQQLVIFLLAGLLLLHFILALSSIRHKSNTFDEYIHVTAGYSYWTMNDFRLQPENGNLPQRWVSLPLLFSRLSFPAIDSPLWEDFNAYEIGYWFFYNLGNDPDVMLLKGRIMVCLLSVILALVVFFWSRQLFGTLGGFISLVLYTFSPTMIAHARLTTSDMASALFFILAVKFLWAVIHTVSGYRIVMAGLAVAGLLLSKMSGVLIAPIVVLMVLVRLLRNKPLVMCFGKTQSVAGRLKAGAILSMALVVIAGISILTIWGFYSFRFAAVQSPEQSGTLSFPAWQQELDRTGSIGRAIAFARDRHLLPEAYLFGFTFVVSRAKERLAFLNGDYRSTGWWHFFPFCYAVKTPLVSMLLLIIGLVLILLPPNRDIIYDLTPLGLFIGVYWMVAMTANINIGHRHILVTYPAFFLLSGATALWLQRLSKRGGALLGIIGIAYVFETAMIWPDYLAFFNVAAGGPQQGYRRLVDSSLDWGQDLPTLQRWLQKNRLAEGNTRVPVYFSYFGTASPNHYGLNTRMIMFRRFPWYPEVSDREVARFGPGIYCISATILQQVYGVGKWDVGNERLYRRLMEFDREYQDARTKPEAWEALLQRYGGMDEIGERILRFRKLQFGRLCHYLLQGEPDHQIGYSILIYFVRGADLKKALVEPLADTVP